MKKTFSKKNHEIKKAVSILNKHSVVAIPTETVYGLAAKINSKKGLLKIFRIKKRPFFDPLIVHISSIDQAKPLVKHWPEAAQILAQHFWPGPLTLVMEKSSKIDNLITSGLNTVALRMPNHPFALEIIKHCGSPLAAPSANKFGKTSPTRADHVRSEFMTEKIFVVDGGNCKVGIESTVLLINEKKSGTQLQILRAGVVTKSEIIKVFKKVNYPVKFFETQNKKLAPGQMKHHYMPRVPLIVFRKRKKINAKIKCKLFEMFQEAPLKIEGVKIIKPRKIEKLVELKLPKNSQLAARVFYQNLRSLALKSPDLIFFVVPAKFDTELWSGLRDRISKAATFFI